MQNRPKWVNMLKKDVIANQSADWFAMTLFYLGFFYFATAPRGSVFREITVYSVSPLVLTTWAYHRALSL